ncbi:hemerythrin domain-containing protein [Flaviaesturariibacter amylovorans]|uniref:Hemerythrin-like domain-containing protein n=1 Tax=Flaviaesturariibacter amylovorans TaxID=1084520 RepID=A0ABP8GH71_9BACT
MAPIKRSPQLAPLSREHHEGLLIVWKIRQGLAKGIETARIGAYLQWAWENDLEAHFRREEEAFARFVPGEPLLARMQEEHETIEGLLHVNAQIADPALLDEIANLLNHHIRFEERTLFPAIERQLSPEQLDALHAQLESEPRKECGAWADEFWVRIH